MSKYWSPIENQTSWRKISLGMWKQPSDPTIYGFETLDVTDTLEYLDQVHEASGVKVSPAALLIWVFSDVFSTYPELNVMIVNGQIQQRHTVDAFCQVAIPHAVGDQADLSGVKIAESDRLDIVEIAKALRGKARRVRDGQDQEIEKQKKLIDHVPSQVIGKAVELVDFLTYNVPLDLDSLGIKSDPFGSFMVSSIAAFDLRLGLAPLVPASRCACVALPGAVFEKPMVHEDEVKPRKVIQVGCTFDHRCYDGYQIGLLVRRVREVMEHPRDHLPAPEFWEG